MPKAPARKGSERRGHGQPERDRMTDDTSVVAERGPFEMVPHWLLHEPSVSALAVRLYMMLRQHANAQATCYPSRQRLAGLLGVSLPTLDKARDQLVEAGAVCMTRRRTEDERWLSTRYHVHWNRQTVCGWASQDSSPPLVKNLHDPSKESSTLTKTHRTKTQELLPASDDFDAFWAVYPRKAGKRDARKAWGEARRGTPSVVLIAGAERYRDDPNREAAYTAHPATWLRAGRWDDEPLPPRSAGRTGGQNRMDAYQNIYNQLNQPKGIGQ
jgi:hypothetical protein